VDTKLLAITDNVETCGFLFAQPFECGAPLSVMQCVTA
jgi:hypothetical protein